MDHSDQSNDPTAGYPANPYAAPLAEEESSFSPTRVDGITLNPWLSIWTQPRATIRQIVDNDPTYLVIPVVILSGISSGLSNVSESAVGEPVDAAMMVGLVVGGLIGGAIGGLLMWLLISWLAKITAHWLGGTATLQEMRAAYAWGQSPGIWLIPVSLVLLFLTQGDPQAAAAANPIVPILLILFGSVQVVVGIWTFVVMCKCIGEVNLFSAWRGFGAMFLAGLLLMVPLMLIAFAIIGAAGV